MANTIAMTINNYTLKSNPIIFILTQRMEKIYLRTSIYLKLILVVFGKDNIFP